MQSRTSFYRFSGAVLITLLLILGVSGQVFAAQFSSASAGIVTRFDQLGRVYVVQPGDSLFTIASRFNVSISELATINRIYDVNVVYVGEVLTLPAPLPANFGQSQIAAPASPVPGSLSAPSIYTPPVVIYSSGTSTTALTTYRSYVVRPGDFLSAIASRFGVTPDAILRANAIADPNLLYVGQLLTIPQVTTVSAPRYTPVLTPYRAGNIYIVQPGDNLFSIGARTGRSAWAIAQANGILDLNAVYIGQPLIIP